MSIFTENPVIGKQTKQLQGIGAPETGREHGLSILYKLKLARLSRLIMITFI